LIPAKPPCYVGLDIGTTNTKGVVLRTDGTIGAVLKDSTPFTTAHGAAFFDLPGLEKIITRFIDEIYRDYHIQGISCTSVGESVTPVWDGTARANPLHWNDPVTADTAKKYPLLYEECNPEPGSVNSTLSIYKILWMREVLNIEGPLWWLPLASYIIYRFTKKAVWDYSQAARTRLFDFRTGDWSKPMLRQFNLEGQLPPLAPMGTYVGEDARGIPYALGGHDHITGLFGVNTLVKDSPFVFDSIGSSESIVTLSDSHGLVSSSGEFSSMGAAFSRTRYYILNAIIFSGTFMKFIARLGGGGDVGAFFDEMNRRLQENSGEAPGFFPIIAGGDPIAGLKRFRLSLINLPMDLDGPNLVHGAYVYMGTMARICIESLSRYTRTEPLIIVGGGGGGNTLYMQYRAAILERPLRILRTGENGGIGAALCAARGVEDAGMFQRFIERQSFTLIEPDHVWMPELKKQSDDLLAFYHTLAETKPMDVFT
jgi:sugar (pentulose or hexulose) kinase